MFNLRKKLNEAWSGADFWDKKENQQQRQQFAAPTKPAPAQTISNRQAPQTASIAKPPLYQQQRDSLADLYTHRANTQDFLDKLNLDDTNKRLLNVSAQKKAGVIDSNTAGEAAYAITKGNKIKNDLVDTGMEKKGNVYVPRKKTGNVETFLNNAGGAIMNVAPQRTAASIAEYGGTLFGNKKVRDWGEKQNKNFRDFNTYAQESASNKTLATGSNIAGNLLTLPLAPQGKIGMATRFTQAGANAAADTSYAIRKGGGSELAQKVGGGIMGVTSGLLNSYGGEKVLNPISGAGKRVTSRLLAAGNNEGLENVGEQFVNNLIAQKTYDPKRKLTDDLASNYGMGLAMGTAVRGGVEIHNRSPKLQQPKLSPSDIATLSDYQEANLKRVNDPKLVNQLHRQVREIGTKNGVDVVSGSPRDINDRINTLVDSFYNTQPKAPSKLLSGARARLTPLNDGGYAKVPWLESGEKDIPQFAQDFAAETKSTQDMINSAADAHFQAAKSNKGGQLIDKSGANDAYGSNVQRISENDPFYREFYKANKRRPTKQDYQAEVQRQLENGGGNLVSPDESQAYGLVKEREIANEQLAKTKELQPEPVQPGVKPEGFIIKETKGRGGRKDTIRVAPNGKGRLKATQQSEDVIRNNIADALNIPKTDRTSTVSDFDKNLIQNDKVANVVNEQTPEYVAKQPRELNDKSSKNEFKDTVNKWLGTKEATKTRATSLARSIDKLKKKDALDAIRAIDDSSYKPKNAQSQKLVNEFRKITDDLYARYVGEKGVKMGYVEDYLPRIYKNPEGGEPLTKSEYQSLMMSTGRMKGREVTGLDENALVTKDPRVLLQKYVESMEKTVNDRAFMNGLVKSGHLMEAPSRPQGTQVVDAPGLPEPRTFRNPDTGAEIQGNYYATPDVAKQLNRMFEPDIRDSTTGKVLRKTAGIASKAQDLGLSGGIPKTPINAFGFAQILRNTMGGNIRGTAKGATLAFSEKATNKYFDKHATDLAELQEQGINVRTRYADKGLKTFMQRVLDAEKKPGQKMTKTKALFAESWGAAMNDPTFSRLLPVMQTDYYMHIRKNLERFGVPHEKAVQLAAQRLKEFEGMTDLATQANRSKVGNDAMTTFLFAPKYREAMINFWGQNVKALAPQNVYKALNPKDGRYRANLVFNAMAMVMFLGMNAANREQNDGKNLWDNPPGKQDKLLINIPGNKTIGIPFLSSIATMPRTGLNIANDIRKGDGEQLAKDAKSFLGYGIRPLADVITNEDYFGNKIRNEQGSFAENLKRSGLFIAKAYSHPWIRGGIDYAVSQNPKVKDEDKKSPLQIVSESSESPIRWYNDKSIKYGAMYADLDKTLSKANNQTKKQFERWHPGRNEMGEKEKFDDNNFFGKERAEALQDDDYFKLEKAYQLAQKKHLGKPLDPLFNLPKDQRQLVLNKKALKPGQSDPQLDKLYEQPWYGAYKDQSSKYYAAKDKWTKKQGFTPFKSDNPYPEAKGEVKKLSDFYNSLPKGNGPRGTSPSRSAWIRNNPAQFAKLKDQWAKQDAWENTERSKYGLAATEGDAGVKNGFKKAYTSSKGKGSGKKKHKFDYKLDGFAKTKNSTSKKLRDILEKAMNGK